MLRAARELLAVRSPLDAELMVSELLGTWWRQQPGRAAGTGGHRSGAAAEVEELVGEGLVDYAADQGSPAALALLSGIACLGTSRQAVKAERAALALMERGVARPGWAEHAGAVEAGGLLRQLGRVLRPRRGDLPLQLRGHATSTHWSWSSTTTPAGCSRDGWVTSQVATLLDRCQELRPAGRAAQTLLQQGLLRRRAGGCSSPRCSSPRPRRAAGQQVVPLVPRVRAGADPHLAAAQASATARTPAAVGSLATAVGRQRTSAASDSGRGPTTPGRRRQHDAAARRRPDQAAAGLIGPGASRRTSWRRDRRAMLAAEFLASDEAEDLSDIEAASRCADHIVDYGCDQDFGRPLRVSPAKAGDVPARLAAAQGHADPGRAARDAARAASPGRAGLAPSPGWTPPRSARRSTRCSTACRRSARSTGIPRPSAWSLTWSRRLLPDRDLEALPRRAFAFGVLEGTFHGTDLSSLDPANPRGPARPAGRRPRPPGRQGQRPEHLDEHAGPGRPALAR